MSFVILNGRKASSTLSWYRNNRIKIPAYQEPSNEKFWEALNGDKDDILVYDRCGRLSSHVKMPLSNLGKFNHVWNAIFRADVNGVCGLKCDAQSTTKPTTAPPATTAPTTATTMATPTTMKTTKATAAQTTPSMKKNKKSQG